MRFSGPTPGPRMAAHPRRIGALGFTIVGLFAAVAAAAPWLARYRVTEVAGEPLDAPSLSHWLGTNLVGQDLGSQLLLGARVSLFVALVAGGGTLLLGALVGTVAGWLGGTTDAVLMRVVDVVLVIPQVPLMVILAAYGSSGLAGISLVIVVTSWPPAARVVRSQVLSLRHRGHLDAAVSFGERTPGVLRRHVLPEIGLILAASLVSAAARAVTLEAGLAFLGVGDPSQASFGRIMRDALSFDVLFETSAWSWWLLPPTLAVALLLLGLTFVGLAVEQRVNPRLTKDESAWRVAA
jgi:peptide/nickel transport system permease protein